MAERPCSGLNAKRSIAAPTAALPAATISIVAGNGVCRVRIAVQPM